MIKQCIAVFLLLAFLASAFSRAVIVADFYDNQDYIAKNLCENRDKPLLHCCGRCQLRKRLAREDSQDKNNPGRRAENNKEVLFAETFTKPPTVTFFSGIDRKYYIQPTRSPVDRAFDIFHPPA